MRSCFKAVLILALGLFALTGCSTTYYSAMEKIGIHKRDILVDRVEDARDAQHDAKEEFSSALERFGSVVAYDGGELQKRYEELDDVFEDCKARASAVTKRIDSVQDVAEALFAEWEEENTQYTSQKLRAHSEKQLRTTRARYKKLLRSMRKAEATMQPVLNTMHDQVLFLKHNLNAQAIAAIKNELTSVRRDVTALVTEMQHSINESNAFIDAMLNEQQGS